MEDFLNDEIDFVLEGKDDIELTEQQRKEIIDNIYNHYDYIWDYIWEDLNNAIQNEIEKILE